MTTIITRLYPDAATAGTVVAALTARGHRSANIDVITAGGDLAATMAAARVGKAAASAYAPHVERGAALVVYRAPFAPLGTARDGIRTVDGFPAIDAGVADENAYIREEPSIDRSSAVLTDHPLFMTRKGSLLLGRMMAGGRVLPPRERRSAISGGAFRSRKILPFPLLREKRATHSAMHGGGHMTRFMGPLILQDWKVSDILLLPMLIKR
jgi:hypothetical protein